MSKFYPLSIAQVQQDTRDAIVVTLSVPSNLRERFEFVQGQHLTLRVMADGQDLRRSYSICSAVGEPDLRIAIKRVSGGLFSSWAHEHFKPGLSVDVMPAMGHFHVPLRPDQPRRYLAVAAGSGITPLLSILKTTLRAEPQSSFTLVYGNRSSSQVMFREELADLKDSYPQRLNLVHVLSREPQDVELFHGRLDLPKYEQLFQRWIRVADHDLAFVCGPQDMMQAVTTALLGQGMQREQIKLELFAASVPRKTASAPTRQVSGAAACEVTLVIDGSHRTFFMEKNQLSVLDAGLRQGMDMRYSCKSGVCSTCRCKLIEGQVDMDASYALEDYEIARGFVLSCQAFPATDRLVLDFDQDL